MGGWVVSLADWLRQRVSLPQALPQALGWMDGFPPLAEFCGID